MFSSFDSIKITDDLWKVLEYDVIIHKASFQNDPAPEEMVLSVNFRKLCTCTCISSRLTNRMRLCNRRGCVWGLKCLGREGFI